MKLILLIIHLFIIQSLSLITGNCGKTCTFTYDEQNNHLIIDGEGIIEDFEIYYWDIRKFTSYKAGRKSSLPFFITLSELMNAKL